VAGRRDDEEMWLRKEEGARLRTLIDPRHD